MSTSRYRQRRKNLAVHITLGFLGLVALTACITAAIIISDEYRAWRTRQEADAAKKEIKRSFDELDRSLKDLQAKPVAVPKEERYVPPQY